MKVSTSVLLLCFLIAVASALPRNNTEIQARNIGIPPNNIASTYLVKESILSEVLSNTVKVGLKSISLIGATIALKFAVLKFMIKPIVWVLKNSLLILLGATGMFAFCKLTNKCGYEQTVIELIPHDNLAIAENHLNNGIVAYRNVAI